METTHMMDDVNDNQQEGNTDHVTIELFQERNTKDRTDIDDVESNSLEVLPDIRRGTFSGLFKFCKDRQRDIITMFKRVLLLVYFVYFGYCMSVKFGDEGSWRLLVCTVFGTIFLIWRKTKHLQVVKTLCDTKVFSCLHNRKVKCVARWVMYVTVSTAIAVFIGWRVKYGDPRNLISIAGIAVFILFLLCMSSDRSKISWHTVYWGFVLQFFFALIILRTEGGSQAILWLSDRFIEIADYAAPGSKVVFGSNYKSVRFAFMVIPRKVVFCALIKVLMDCGILQFININLGKVLAFITDVTPPEAICATANMFLASAEAAYIIIEYLDDLSESQLFCVIVCGLSSLAGTAMITYMGLGIPLSYLIAGSVMSAPAALAAAKIVMPGTEDDLKDLSAKRKPSRGKRRHLFNSLSAGGMQGINMGLYVIVNIIVFYGFLAFMNSTVKWFGQQAGLDNMSLEFLVSYVTWPCAYLMGVEFDDCVITSKLLAIRFLSTPVIPYSMLGDLIKNKELYNDYRAVHNDTVFAHRRDILLPQWNMTLHDGIISERSTVITTYALAGFSSLTTIGTSMGVFSSIAPNRIATVGRLVFKAVIVATIASYFTACMAGLLF